MRIAVGRPDRSGRHFSWWYAIVLLSVAGCTSLPSSQVDETAEVLQARLEGDIRILNSLRQPLDALDEEFSELNSQGDWSRRGYFSVAESNRMEHLLFRFITSYSTLRDISDAYDTLQYPLDDPLVDAKVHVVAYQAGLLLANHSAFLVAEFAGDRIAIAKMNEAFYRSAILPDRYYELARSVTAERLSSLQRADTLAAIGLATPDSPLARLVATEASYRTLVDVNRKLQGVAEKRMRAALEGKGSSKPEVIKKASDVLADELYSVRAMLFKNVSRMKQPAATLVRFSDQQKALIRDRLVPGDLIFSYTAGYISDVFIPGSFKHGMTYVGSPEQRDQFGLAPNLSSVLPQARHELVSNLARARLDNGKQADMIEAVAEGVIFNNLEHILDTHINRLLVLRPRVTPAERSEYLTQVFSYIGQPYDFRFDFVNASRQVCTELIYRGIQGKGGIALELTERAGHLTISADDIALYYLNTHPEAFELVLYAEEDPHGDNHQAHMLTGQSGVERLRELLES